MLQKMIQLSLFFMFNVSLLAMPPHPRLQDQVRTDQKQLEKMQLRLNTMKARSKSSVPSKAFPTTGDHKVCVIKVAYSGGSFNGASTNTFYDELFEGGGSTSLTWRKYYQDMSNNRLNLSFDIYGPYTANNIESYYGANDSSGNDRRPRELVKELVGKANGDIDFSQYDNNNDGYVDTVVVIVEGQGEEYSGSSNDIWSHNWNLSGIGNVTYDGVQISNYTIQPEYVASAGDSTIGVFCHEFGHALGLPDLYDITYKTNGVGRWSLMSAGSWNGNNGDLPAPLLAWERAELGWIDVVKVDVPVREKGLATTTAPGSGNNPLYIILLFLLVLTLLMIILISKNKRLLPGRRLALLTILFGLLVGLFSCIPPVPADFGGMMFTLEDINTSHEAIKIYLDYGYQNHDQYILIENIVKKNNTWTQELPGNGLLITRVDEYILDKIPFVGGIEGARNVNMVNSLYADYDLPFGVGIVEADQDDSLISITDGDNASAKDLFYSNHGAGFNFSYFNYSSNTSGGNKDSRLVISDISSRGEQMSFYAYYRD